MTETETGEEYTGNEDGTSARSETCDVFLHTRNPRTPHEQWRNEQRRFARIPMVGEHVALSMHSPIFKVVNVVHCPFKCQFDAEVYALQITVEEHHASLRGE
jgi:hypothetical protein